MSNFNTQYSEDALLLLHKYFKNITEKDLQLDILAHGEIINIPKGATIMDYGNYIRSIPLVLDGIIKVSRQNEDGQELFLHYLKPGDTCSITLTCCRIDKKSLLKSVAETDTTIIKVPVAQMDTWMAKYPSWKNFIMLSYDRYLSQLITNLDSVTFMKMDERLMDYLNQKAEILNTRQIEISHAAIATDLNASRETISRLLKQMEKDGEVKLGRNKIVLK